MFPQHSWVGYFPFIWAGRHSEHRRVLLPEIISCRRRDCSGGRLEVAKAFGEVYSTTAWLPGREEDCLLQPSLIGVTFLLVWVGGICPDRRRGKFHALRRPKDAPGDGGAGAPSGRTRAAEQRGPARRGEPEAGPAPPAASALRSGSRPKPQPAPSGLRGDGTAAAPPPSGAASRLAFPAASASRGPPPCPPPPPASSGAPGLLGGPGPAQRLALSARAPPPGAEPAAGAAAAQRLPALPDPPPRPPGSVLPARRRRLGSSSSFLA